MCGHTFLYSPPVQAVKRMIDGGDARRHLLHLVQPGEPRPAPARRQRDLGPRSARLLDPALLAERAADQVRAVGRDSIVKGIADVAFVTMTFASGVIANVELSWLAPSKLRRTVWSSARADGRSTTTARPSRCGCSTAASSTATRRPSASTTCPTAPATSSRRGSSPTSRSGSSSAISSTRSGPDAQMEFHTALARSVVRIVEAADASLPPRRARSLVDHGDIGTHLTARRELAAV